VTRYQKGKTNLDFTEATDSEWQWHQLGQMQVCTSLQTDNRTSTPLLSFLQAGCPSCRPTNSVKALKATPLPKSLLLYFLCIAAKFVITVNMMHVTVAVIMNGTGQLMAGNNHISSTFRHRLTVLTTS